MNLQIKNDITLNVNSGVLTQIYTQLFSSMSDFYGVLIGSVKDITNKRAMDNDSNFERITHIINICFVIFIHDKRYLESDKLKAVIEKIQKKYKNTENEILGILSARSYSYSNLSFKEQNLYKKVQQCLDSQLPLIFGVFTNNNPEITEINSLKSIELATRFFKLDNNK